MLAVRAVVAGSLLFVTTAGAQAPSLPTATLPDATVSAPKSPMTARLLAIVPGAGHMYAGETESAIAVAALMSGILMAGVLVSAMSCLPEPHSDPPSDCDRTRPLRISGIVAGGLWLYSIFDAGRAAQRTNAKKAGRTSLLLEPTRMPVANGGDRGAVRLGLQISTW
jgi:hypothetical protein